MRSSLNTAALVEMIPREVKVIVVITTERVDHENP